MFSFVIWLFASIHLFAVFNGEFHARINKNEVFSGANIDTVSMWLWICLANESAENVNIGEKQSLNSFRRSIHRHRQQLLFVAPHEHTHNAVCDFIYIIFSVCLNNGFTFFDSVFRLPAVATVETHIIKIVAPDKVVQDAQMHFRADYLNDDGTPAKIDEKILWVNDFC